MAYPSELTSQLKSGDSVVRFVSLKYGWVALTEERLLYQGRLVYDDGSKQVENGNIPISKISSLTTRQMTFKACLGKKKVGVLEVNVQGAKYSIEVGKDVSIVKPLISEFVSRT